MLKAKLASHRQPIKIYVPTKKDGSSAKILLGESKSISDRQVAVEALREDDELKRLGIGARTQQSMTQEVRNRALIQSIKFVTNKEFLPEADCKLSLKDGTVTYKGEVICRVGESGDLEWLRP